MSIRIVRSEKDLPIRPPLEATEAMQRSFSPESYGWFVSDQFLVSFVVQRNWIFKKLVFTSEIVPIGIGTLEMQPAFIEEALSKAADLSVHFVSQSPAYVIIPFVPQGASACPFGTLQINLAPTEEELWSNVHSKHRNVIKKAKSDGLIVESGDQFLPICAKMIQETMQRQKKDFISESALSSKKAVLGEKLRFYIVREAEEVQGCAVIAWEKGSKGLYLFGGSHRTPKTGALNYLQWQIILDLKSLDVKVYDLVGARIKPQEGSKYEGIQRFKERMGAKLVEGYLWRYPISRTMYLLYRSAVILRSLVKEKKISSDVIDEEAKRHKASLTHV